MSKVRGAKRCSTNRINCLLDHWVRRVRYGSAEQTVLERHNGEQMANEEHGELKDGLVAKANEDKSDRVLRSVRIYP